MKIPAGLLLAFVPFRADVVQLLVVGAVAFEAANMIETSLICIARCQCLDTQVKSHDTPITQQVAWLAFVSFLSRLMRFVLVLLCLIIDKRTIVVPACIPGHGDFVKVLRGAS